MKEHFHNTQKSHGKTSTETKRSPIPLVLIISTLFTLGFAYISYNSRVLSPVLPILTGFGEQPPTLALLGGLFITLFILNPLVYLFIKRKLFDTEGLVLLSVMLMTAGTFFTRDTPTWLMTLMGLPYMAYENPAKFQPLLDAYSPLIIPRGDEVFMGFMNGGMGVPWNAWIMPIILWGLFIFACFSLNMSVASIVRRRWTDVEHLRYPLILPIINMIGEEKEGDDSLLGSIWHNKLMWGGFSVAFFLIFYSQLQIRFPGLPQIPWDYNSLLIGQTLYQLTGGTIWRYIMGPTGGFHPNFWGIEVKFLGIAYLIPTLEILLSWTLAHFGRIIPNLVLYNTGRWNSYPMNMREMWTLFAFGGVFALGLFQLYLNRQYFKERLTGAFARNGDDSQEPLSDPRVIFLFIGSSLFIFIFLMVFLHYKVWMAFLYVFMWIAMVLGFARMRAEGAYNMERPGPSNYFIDIQKDVIGGFVGQKAIGMTGLTSISILAMHDCNSRNGSIADILECWKLGDELGVSRRGVTKAIVAAFLIAMIVLFATALPFIYNGDGVRMAPRNTYVWRSFTWLKTTTEDTLKGPQPAIIGWFIAGAIITGLLGWLRMQFIWWPIHPIGFVWGVQYQYTEVANFVIVAILRAIIMRYGGLPLYRKLRPFFIGLILGGGAAGVFGSMVNIIGATFI
jgi:hypothetical protein